MKKLLKLATAITAVIMCAISLVGCGGSFSKAEITDETLSTYSQTVRHNTLSNTSNTKYEATYKYDKKGSSYNTKYDVKMKVNGDAGIGEVFALIEFNTFYTQDDGNHGRDLLIQYAIVRSTSGNYYSNYKINMVLGKQSSSENTFSVTFSDMVDALIDDGYWCSTESRYMTDILDDDDIFDSYYNMLIAFAELKYGDYLVSSGDNPLVFCSHAYNKGGFLNTLNDLDSNSSNNGYSLYSSGDNAFRIKRKKTFSNYGITEEYKLESTITVHEDKTYTYKSYDYYKTNNPARLAEVTKEHELKPITGTIEKPAWALQ
ncbi:MAG: hypothetical protein IKL82_03240 [Clostridia bacterium]|nr:hypothetical protein [Clostridia bacterium]